MTVYSGFVTIYSGLAAGSLVSVRLEWTSCALKLLSPVAVALLLVSSMGDYFVLGFIVSKLERT